MDRRLLYVLIVGLGAIQAVQCAMTIEQMEKTAVGIRNTCIRKSGAVLDQVAGMKKGEFSDEQTLKCYVKCVMSTIRTMKNGEVDLDLMLKQLNTMLPADMASRMSVSAKACIDQATGADACEAAYNFIKCNYFKDPEVFFFP